MDTEKLTRLRLTIGLMGLDQLHLRVLSMASDDEVERKNAGKGALHSKSPAHSSYESFAPQS